MEQSKLGYHVAMGVAWSITIMIVLLILMGCSKMGLEGEKITITEHIEF